MTTEKIAVIGLGFVGLPLAVALSEHYDVIGFDINQVRITELQAGKDRTDSVEIDELKAAKTIFTTDANLLNDCTVHIVAVPTPVDDDFRPNLSAMKAASKTVAQHLQKGAVVVYESTVYPGVTEDVCAPILEAVSGLKCGTDFYLGYSPERVSPGDSSHLLRNTIKVISGQTPEVLTRLTKIYNKVIEAGLHLAPSIKVAEAAKIIENVQRDVNIALMNELAMIFNKLHIPMKDVLAAAGTKFNWVKVAPGLVGGHCISVDPYYLIGQAESLGFYPELMRSARRINNGMSQFVVGEALRLLSQRQWQHNISHKPRVGVLGVTYKPDVPDLRNTLVPHIVKGLKTNGLEVLLHDHYADEAELQHETGLGLNSLDQFKDLDLLILAVPHASYKQPGVDKLVDAHLANNGVLMDISGAFFADAKPDALTYWAL